MALTEVQIKQAKPKDKRYMLRDDRGLYLEVMTSGNKHWRLRYWEAGKEHKISLGEYPGISLRQARDKRDEIRLNRAQGISPRAQQVSMPTFEAIALEWYESHVKPLKSPAYSQDIASRMKRLLFPNLGHRPIQEITAPEILAMLRIIEHSGKIHTAHKLHQICGRVFRYAIATGRVERNPAADLQGAIPPAAIRHNASLTAPKDIAVLLRAMDNFPGSIIVKNALWFSAYTFVRPGEVRHAEWSEINLDKSEWKIPAEKMKMRRPHIVPLSRQVIALLQPLQILTGHGQYVFLNIRSPKGLHPMSQNTVNVALRSLGFTKEQMTAHGFRSMASTNLNEQGWPPDVIERQLAHVEGNSVRAAYNYAEYLPERRKMMQHWADWLDSLKEEGE